MGMVGIGHGPDEWSLNDGALPSIHDYDGQLAFPVVPAEDVVRQRLGQCLARLRSGADDVSLADVTTLLLSCAALIHYQNLGDTLLADRLDQQSGGMTGGRDYRNSKLLSVLHTSAKNLFASGPSQGETDALEEWVRSPSVGLFCQCPPAKSTAEQVNASDASRWLARRLLGREADAIWGELVASEISASPQLSYFAGQVKNCCTQVVEHGGKITLLSWALASGLVRDSLTRTLRDELLNLFDLLDGKRCEFEGASRGSSSTQDCSSRAAGIQAVFDSSRVLQSGVWPVLSIPSFDKSRSGDERLQNLRAEPMLGVLRALLNAGEQQEENRYHAELVIERRNDVALEMARSLMASDQVNKQAAINWRTRLAVVELLFPLEGGENPVHRRNLKEIFGGAPVRDDRDWWGLWKSARTKCALFPEEARMGALDVLWNSSLPAENSDSLARSKIDADSPELAILRIIRKLVRAIRSSPALEDLAAKIAHIEENVENVKSAKTSGGRREESGAVARPGEEMEVRFDGELTSRISALAGRSFADVIGVPGALKKLGVYSKKDLVALNGIDILRNPEISDNSRKFLLRLRLRGMGFEEEVLPPSEEQGACLEKKLRSLNEKMARRGSEVNLGIGTKLTEFMELTGPFICLGPDRVVKARELTKICNLLGEVGISRLGTLYAVLAECPERLLSIPGLGVNRLERIGQVLKKFDIQPIDLHDDWVSAAVSRRCRNKA